MSAVALHLYEKLNVAANDQERSKAIVDAFSELEERYPNLKDASTQRDLSETELRLQLQIKTVEANLQKDIEQTRLEIEKVRGEIEKVRGEVKTVEANLQMEIKTVEANLQMEIKAVEANLQMEIKAVEANLQLEIAKVRGETEKVRGEIKATEVNLTRELHKHTLWVISSVGAIVGMIRLTDWFASHL